MRHSNGLNELFPDSLCLEDSCFDVFVTLTGLGACNALSQPHVSHAPREQVGIPISRSDTQHTCKVSGPLSAVIGLSSGIVGSSSGMAPPRLDRQREGRLWLFRWWNLRR